MNTQEKLQLLAKALDCDPKDLSETMELASVEEWDSLAMISLLALMDKNFGKKLSAPQLREFRFVADILQIMEKESK